MFKRFFKVQTVFVENAKKYLKEWYGQDPKTSGDLTRIVNSNHFKRLVKLLEGTKGKIALGGDKDSEDLYIAPTLVGGWLIVFKNYLHSFIN